MFTFKQRFMLVTLLFIAVVANAQKINVTGRILDSQQNPLPGAGVVINGTNSGTTADLDGNYTISAPADAVLEFSYLGYESQMVNVNSRAIINVVLEEESNFLNETVVVGYGTQNSRYAAVLFAGHTAELILCCLFYYYALLFRKSNYLFHSLSIFLNKYGINGLFSL